jgi:Leucine-rich repeat (LRR) protein
MVKKILFAILLAMASPALAATSVCDFTAPLKKSLGVKNEECANYPAGYRFNEMKVTVYPGYEAASYAEAAALFRQLEGYEVNSLTLNEYRYENDTDSMVSIPASLKLKKLSLVDVYARSLVGPLMSSGSDDLQSLSIRLYSSVPAVDALIGPILNQFPMLETFSFSGAPICPADRWVAPHLKTLNFISASQHCSFQFLSGLSAIETATVKLADENSDPLSLPILFAGSSETLTALIASGAPMSISEDGLPALRSLQIDYLAGTHFTAAFFENHPNLSSLQNRAVKDRPDVTLNQTNPALTRLMINFANRIEISESASYPNLVAADFSKPVELQLPSSVCRTFPKINYLKLTGAPISEIPEGLFRDCKDTLALDLSQTPITELKKGIWKNLSRVQLTFPEHLNYLGDGVLSRVIPASLAHTGNTDFVIPQKQLDLSNHGLTDFTCDGQNLWLSSLTEVNLSGNRLTQIPEKCFRDSPEKSSSFSVDLSKNQISNLRSGAFRNVSMKELFLTENPLQVIETGALSGLPLLETLFIEGSSLKTLAPSSIGVLPKVQKISFQLPSAFHLRGDFIDAQDHKALLFLPGLGRVSAPVRKELEKKNFLLML